MGISKSIKGLFMKKKSKSDIESSSTDSGIKSPKTKPKRRVSAFRFVNLVFWLEFHREQARCLE